LTTGGRAAAKKFADYLLCYTRDFPLAVEAKRKPSLPGWFAAGKEYAELLGLKFASTNGTESLV